MGIILPKKIRLFKTFYNQDVWKGFCFDIFHELATRLNFSYDVTSVETTWGTKNSTTGKWNGMIGEISQNNADMGIQIFSDMNERREVEL